MIFKFKNRFLRHLLLVFILTTIACKTKYYSSNYSYQKIQIDSSEINSSNVTKFIAPYKSKIDNDLNITLSYTKTEISKNDDPWNSSLGSLISEIGYETCNLKFFHQKRQNIDVVLFNYGGIRSTINKGNISKRTAFEVMPFENKFLVLKVKGSVLIELAQYIINDKKAHPISGMKIYYKTKAKEIECFISNEKIESEKFYHLLTSDYLANGGDNMIFLKNSLESTDLNYKVRDALIDYFSVHKEITVSKIENIIIQ